MSLSQTAIELAQEDGDAMFDVLGLISEPIQIIHPGTDFIDGHLYMTFPSPRTRKVKVGKGKDATTEDKREITTIYLRDDYHVNEYNEETMLDAGYGWPNVFTRQEESRWRIDAMRAFLVTRDAAPRINSLDLFNSIREIFTTYVEFTDQVYYDILPLYVLSSYVFTIFESTPYLHFHGSKASGKSQNLNVLTALGFNTIWASNLSAASLYRTVAGCPGILALDEAEGFEGERGEELRRILNSGYKRGSKVGRIEKVGETFVPVQYDVYCPKVIASINSLESVIASRSILIEMSPAIRSIPQFRVNDTRWEPLRAEIYAWAMQNARAIAETAETWGIKPAGLSTNLRNREWELAHPLLVIAQHVGGDAMVERLIPFFEREAADKIKAQENSDRQVTLLQALPTAIHNGSEEESWYQVDKIHEIVLGFLETDQKEYYRSRAVTRHLGSLGFRKTRRKKGGTQVWIEEQQLRDEITRRNIEPFAEDLAWFNGEVSYLHTPIEQVDKLSWLDEVEVDDE